ncbi:MAG TPA: hypothetical protein PK765_03340 [bacterium]|nr:hypothetical protein [bacterium]
MDRSEIIALLEQIAFTPDKQDAVNAMIHRVLSCDESMLRTIESQLLKYAETVSDNVTEANHACAVIRSSARDRIESSEVSREYVAAETLIENLFA